MTEEQITHIRWTHVSLFGFCITFLLVALSIPKADSSFWLDFSIICFSVGLPLTCCLACFHFYAIETGASTEVVSKLIDTTEATIMTFGTVLVVVFGVFSCIGHLSVWAFGACLVTSVFGYWRLIPFLSELEKSVSP